MRLVIGVFAVAFLVACAATQPAASAPSSSTSATSSCRLPFLKLVAPDKWQAGFFVYPAGTFTADPTAPPNPGYYDHVVSRWVPVGRNAVAPDGRHYAYMSGGMGLTPGPPRLHVVDAATGVEQVLPLALSDQQPYGVEDYASDGIYIGSGWEGVTFGRWRVDPTSGALTDFSQQDHFLDDGTGHAWVSVFNSSDLHPVRSAMSGDPMPNELGRRDLKSGTVETWFYHPGFSVALAGAFVGGGILAWVEPPQGPHEYWLVTSPGASRLVVQLDGAGGAIADRHGIWMGGNDGLYLFTPDGKARLVSNLAGDPVDGCL